MKPSNFPSWSRWLPAVAYAGLIFIASSIPPPILIPVSNIDKVIHFFEYSILCYLLCWAQARPDQSASLIKRAALFSIIISSLYGASDEIHQHFVPNRIPEILDWVADTAGASFTGFLWYRRRLKSLNIPASVKADSGYSPR